MQRFIWAVCLVLAVSPVTAATPKSPADDDEPVPRLGESQTQRVTMGMVVTAEGGPCRGIVATAPIPIDWPEQQVKEVDSEITAHVKSVDYRMIGNTVRQMIVEIPYLEAGEEARALVTYEIVRSSLIAPDDAGQYEIPKKIERDVRTYLGPSPGIEVRHAKIRSLAKEITADKSTAWEKVEAIYDWVRANVTYREGPFKGAATALKNGSGDCEELSSLFIAMCRSEGIPARTVWIPGHCYPEFYLADANGKGHWFPCQAAGSRAFGGILEYRPILQKGDNFLTPERPKDKLRYVSEFLTGAGGKPKVRFIRENDEVTRAPQEDDAAVNARP